MVFLQLLLNSLQEVVLLTVLSEHASSRDRSVHVFYIACDWGKTVSSDRIYTLRDNSTIDKTDDCKQQSGGKLVFVFLVIV